MPWCTNPLAHPSAPEGPRSIKYRQHKKSDVNAKRPAMRCTCEGRRYVHNQASVTEGASPVRSVGSAGCRVTLRPQTLPQLLVGKVVVRAALGVALATVDVVVLAVVLTGDDGGIAELWGRGATPFTQHRHVRICLRRLASFRGHRRGRMHTRVPRGRRRRRRNRCQPCRRRYSRRRFRPCCRPLGRRGRPRNSRHVRPKRRARRFRRRRTSRRR